MVPTQDATVSFQEYKELECIYKAILKENETILIQNDELRQSSESMAKQYDVMKSRVKEWTAFFAKKSKKRVKGQRGNGQGKAAMSFQIDVERPPTPASLASSSLKPVQTPKPDDDINEMHHKMAQEASGFLALFESPLSLKGASVTAKLSEVDTAKGSKHQEPAALHSVIEDDLPMDHYNGRNDRIAQKESIQISSDQLHSGEDNQDEGNPYARRNSPRVTSSQTTQDETNDHTDYAKNAANQHQSDHDEPVVVSERSLKRKHPARLEVYQDPPGRHTEPPHIKEEPREIQAAPPAIPALLHRASTLDLDEVGLHFQTPRKRRRMQDLIQNSQWSKARPVLRHERSSSLPLQSAVVTGASETVKLEAQDENVVLEIPDSDPSPVDEEDEVTVAPNQGVKTRSPDNPRKAILRSRDVNIRAQPQFEGLRPRQGRSRRDIERGAKAVPMLSEDGEETQIRELSPEKKEESRRRFAELYDNPPPEKKALASPKTPAIGRATRSTPKTSAGKQITTRTPKAPSTASKKRSSTSKIPTPQTSIKLPRPESSTRSFQRKQDKPAEPPLRSKPLDQIQLCDFKVNPNTNAGLEYAYTEVVRGREARRCLPGCTALNCCGRDLRALITAGLDPPLPRSFWDDDESPDHAAGGPNEKDHGYLRWSMGPSYNRDRIDAMPTAMREDLVVQAKVKLLANQAGRHRHAHQRARTPPGFWRTDFPGTQEAAKDREEARKMEREVVEERWMEAMREGGRWLFRDE